jgi:division protein CdvB (Snf7/Vps24/ESCRT-III family)
MVSIKLHRSKPFNEALTKTITGLNKECSRLELITRSLRKRDQELFEICKASLEKGQEERARIYANEVSEIRKTLSLVTTTKLTLEKTSLRLGTIKEVCPTLQELNGIFSNVKDTLTILADTMPSMSPEMDALNAAVTEMLSVTESESLPTIEPIVIKDEATEAIIQEASGVAEEELKRKIPEPPILTHPTSSKKATKPMVALTTGGVEIYEDSMENYSAIDDHRFQPSPPSSKSDNSLLEELVLDYIYRSNGEIELTRCAEELGIAQNDVLNVLDVLRAKGKIRIEQ